MTTRSQESSATTSQTFAKGQRLYCASCGSEIEVISPCTCKESHQILQCCGQDMMPATGAAVNVNVGA